MPIKLLVVDDHGVLRAGLIALLNSEPDMEVVGEADDENSAVSQAIEKRPDVILMDMSMPDAGGLDATRRIKQLVPEAKVLVLTVHEDKGMMQEAIRSGAMGYILKRAIKSELINAIHSVMRDELYLHPAMARLLFMEEKNSPVQAAKTSSVTLTFREIEVLRMIAQGYTNNQAAEKLKISVRTVEYHRGNLTDKLNLRSRVELMRYAEEKGLI
jgi:two-component system response regulator NreC